MKDLPLFLQEGIESLPSSVVVHLDYNKVAPPMEVLLPGESGPMLRETDLPELPYELRMKIMSKITAEVPGWKTSKLERSNSRSGIDHDAERARGRSMSSEQVQVDPSPPTRTNSTPVLSSSTTTTTTSTSSKSSKLWSVVRSSVQKKQNKCSILSKALGAARTGKQIEVTFGPGEFWTP